MNLYKLSIWLSFVTNVLLMLLAYMLARPYTYYGYLLYQGGRAKAEEFVTQWNITSAYVMHFKGTSELQWRSPHKRTCYHRELKKSHTYLDKYNLSKYRKIILLENFDEIVEFITAMGCYPTFARYDEFYLFCNNNIFLMIGYDKETEYSVLNREKNYEKYRELGKTAAALGWSDINDYQRSHDLYYLKSAGRNFNYCYNFDHQNYNSKMPKINEFKCAVWLTLAPPVIIFCLIFFPDFTNFLEVFIGTGGKTPLFNLLFLLLMMQMVGLYLWLKMIGFYLFRKITKKQVTKQPYDSKFMSQVALAAVRGELTPEPFSELILFMPLRKKLFSIKFIGRLIKYIFQ